jgi:hypothetical protein
VPKPASISFGPGLLPAFILWLCLLALRLWNHSWYAGVSDEDVALALQHPLTRSFLGILDRLDGASITHIPMVFALLRSLGEWLLALSVRQVFPQWKWAALFVVALSGASYLGAVAEKQHIAVWMFLVPASLWFYARTFTGGGVSHLFMCAFLAGLCVTSQTMGIIILLPLFIFEVIRLRLLGRSSFPIGARSATAAVGALLGMAVSGALQQREPLQFTADFSVFLRLFSWEGIILPIHAIAIFVLFRRESLRRDVRLLLMGLIPFYLVSLSILGPRFESLTPGQIAMGALPFCWVLSAGAVSLVLERLGKGDHWFIRPLPVCISLAALMLASGHQKMLLHFASGYASLEKWLDEREITEAGERPVFWLGDERVASLLLGKNWTPYKEGDFEIMKQSRGTLILQTPYVNSMIAAESFFRKTGLQTVTTNFSHTCMLHEAFSGGVTRLPIDTFSKDGTIRIPWIAVFDPGVEPASKEQ